MGHHNHKITGIIILFLIALISFIVSCATYWYESRIQASNDTYSAVYSKYNQVKTIVDVAGHESVSYFEPDYENGTKNVLNLYRLGFGCSLVCAILGSILFLVLLLSSSSHHHRAGHGGSIITRFFPILMLLVSIVGAVSFVFLPTASKWDCQDLTNDSSLCNDERSFIGSSENLGIKTTWNPYIGWAMAVVGSFFTLIATILNVRHGHHHHHGYSRI